MDSRQIARAHILRITGRFENRLKISRLPPIHYAHPPRVMSQPALRATMFGYVAGGYVNKCSYISREANVTNPVYIYAICTPSVTRRGYVSVARPVGHISRPRRVNPAGGLFTYNHHSYGLSYGNHTHNL